MSLMGSMGQMSPMSPMGAMSLMGSMGQMSPMSPMGLMSLMSPMGLTSAAMSPLSRVGELAFPLICFFEMDCPQGGSLIGINFSTAVIPSLLERRRLSARALDRRTAQGEILPLRFTQGFGSCAQDDRWRGEGAALGPGRDPSPSFHSGLRLMRSG